MSCGRCGERGRALKVALVAARQGDGAAVRREAANITRTLSEDTKAFARILRVKLTSPP